MNSIKNPFPGMNPYLERRWPDVHTRLTVYVRDDLADQLPIGLVARIEENEPATPEIIHVEPLTERWLQVSTPDGKVVTIIEILSPTNKTGDGRDRYLRKQSDYLSTDVNLVVIDFIRSGQSVLPVPAVAFEKRPPQTYHICTARYHDPDTRELYRIPLRQRLPAIRIPLRRTDADVIVDLQPLIDRCYEMGGYWQADYSADPEPPLDAEERVWVDEQLRTAGLR